MTIECLEAQSVKYFSQFDEDMFFAWLAKIEGVLDFAGSGNTLFIRVETEQLTEKSIYEFIAIFRRYAIEMSQLAKYASGDQKAWLLEGGGFN